jgi:hypothetical protein
MYATMRCELITPDTLIQPRAISSTHSAYVSSDSPGPSYSSGMVSPKVPSSLRPSMISDWSSEKPAHQPLKKS